MQTSQDYRDAQRTHACSEEFNWRCNAIRKDTEAFLRKAISEHFTPLGSSGLTKAEFIEQFISGLSLDVAFDEVRADDDLVGSILLQDD